LPLKRVAGTELAMRQRAGRRRWVGAGEGSIVANIGPYSPGAGLADVEHRHSGVIGMYTLGGEAAPPCLACLQRRLGAFPGAAGAT